MKFFVASLVFCLALGPANKFSVPPYFPNSKFDPPDNTWYLSHIGNLGTVHHELFFHNVGPSISNAQKADILIVGNSRVLTGFDWRMLESFSHKYGVKFFNMGLGGGEGQFFYMKLMKKHKLRPKILLVNVDVHRDAFFRKNPSVKAAGVIKTPRDKFLKNFYARNLNLRVWQIANASFPAGFERYFPILFQGWSRKNQLIHDPVYRSSFHGGLFLDFKKRAQALPISLPKKPHPCVVPALQMNIASRVEKKLRQWGIKMVTTSLPHNWLVRKCVVQVTKKIKAPYIFIPPDDMTTFDSNHLDQRSAKLFTEKFLKYFKLTQPFREMIAAKNERGMARSRKVNSP